VTGVQTCALPILYVESSINDWVVPEYSRISQLAQNVDC
jgi:hypothetical protein